MGAQVRLDDDVEEWIDDQRDADGRSRTAMVNDVIRDTMTTNPGDTPAEGPESDEDDQQAPTVVRAGHMSVSSPQGRRRGRPVRRSPW